MYFDSRLWPFTEGVRDRLFAVAALGVLASAAGVVRLALLGWLVGRALSGAAVGELVLPAVLTAVAIFVRTGLEHWRTLVSHRPPPRSSSISAPACSTICWVSAPPRSPAFAPARRRWC